MLRIKNLFNHMVEIEKSRFICYVQRCFDEEQAKKFIAETRKQHPKANHHCYAYVIGSNHEISRSNDDNEPAGTAGLPMLESLRLSGIQDCVCVVVRYFGGIKLGTGGLVRAYSSIVSETLRLAPVVKLVKVYCYAMNFDYELIGRFDFLLSQKNAIILDKEYGELVYYRFNVLDTSFLADIQEYSSGKVIPQYLSEEIIEIDR